MSDLVVKDIVLIGQTFDKLTVMSRQPNNGRNSKTWLCACECGNTTTVVGSRLKNKQTKSCGCIKTGPKIKNLDGQKFSRLTVLSFSHRDKWRTALYICKCECGNECIVSSRSLKTSSTRSCGCLKQEVDNDRKGNKNPGWDPNRTDHEREIGRNFDGYKDWNISVKQRDNFTCQVCKRSHSGHLVSHHLYNYHDFPQWRIELWNGVCLCYDCHMSFHNQYGRRHNTKPQFDKFVKEYVEYIYWWDVNGVYNQHYITGGQIFIIRDQPLTVNRVSIDLNVSKQ